MEADLGVSLSCLEKVRAALAAADPEGVEAGTMDTPDMLGFVPGFLPDDPSRDTMNLPLCRPVVEKTALALPKWLTKNRHVEKSKGAEIPKIANHLAHN